MKRDLARASCLIALPALFGAAFALPSCANDFTRGSGENGGNGGTPDSVDAGSDAAQPSQTVPGISPRDSGVPSDSSLGGDADGGAALDAGPKASDCDFTGAAPCVPSPATGLFAAPAPQGSDASGDGSPGSPFASIARAMSAAKSAGKPRVFACVGTYDAVAVTGAATDGVHVYGALDCATWKYTGVKSTVAPAAPGYALHLEGVRDVGFDDMAFVAKDGAGDGASSVAAFVHLSSGVVFRRAAFEAGKGVDGKSAAAIAEYASAAPKGNSAVAPDGGAGAAITVVCANGSGTTTGGAGGAPNSKAGDANGPQAGSPTSAIPHPAAATGAGGITCHLDAFGSGQDGSDGAVGAALGAPTNAGSLSDSGWVASTGLAGPVGSVAQGGGGGSSNGGAESSTDPPVALPGEGGGGGAGGCGGSGGSAGGGGGASIGFLSLDSDVACNASTTRSSIAGTGGAGAPGQRGQLGGAVGLDKNNACGGGMGGAGGSGGGGGGGAGGISVGIGWKGTPPTLDGTLVPSANVAPGYSGPAAAARGGAKGAGGAPARTTAPASLAGPGGADGPTGIVAAVANLP